MNTENMAQLRDWLLAGAPHLDRFDMMVGVDACGTTCCIAGYAYQAKHGFRTPTPDDLEEGELEIAWDLVKETALEWLGLTSDGVNWYGHRLFHGPLRTTPQQAAQAVQNVMEGREPWPV